MIAKTELVLDRDLLIQDKERLVELKNILAAAWTEVAEQLAVYETT